MIDNIIDFYSKNLNLTGLIKRYYGFYFNAVVAIYFIVLLGFLLYCYFCEKNLFYFYLLIFILIIFLFTARICLNYYTIKKISPEFLDGKDYSYQKLNNYFFEELEKYLNKEHLVEIEDEIISRLKEKAQSIKTPLIFFYGIFSALLACIFASFCNKLYEMCKNFNDICLITGLLIMIVVSVIYLLDFIKYFYFDYFTKYNQINNLINMLEENKLRRSVEAAKKKNCSIVI
ncbi:hypothetical protein PG275_10270 [Riemerella anatipestifer]|uniref:hypothetical protein n=1 Tax=Riemerella anatipestifer TaxID=34085 RepID=UPI002A8E6572|nr:hypothetical protein [Riemerella anatipestifer]